MTQRHPVNKCCWKNGAGRLGQGASQEAQCVKNLPAMQENPEIWVRFLGWEDPLEEGTETYSSILAWRILWTEAPGRLQSIGRKESDMTEATEHSTMQVSLMLTKIFFLSQSIRRFII